ncbi:MAG: FmdB family transcriptional regulator [Actinomycetota bacterium]|nr:FmdB family transcriptional regulator [Actinomycetota bacterium]
MPTYQYACTACDHRFEAVQSFSDAALTECPECQGSVRKLFSSVGIVFKGSGFYRTDSRPGSKTADGAKAPAESVGSGESAKAETKAPAKDAGTASTTKAPSSTGESAA